MTQRAMQEATFLILTALAAGSQHGYGILTDVREISGGLVQLRAGTLYTALDRLRADGLVEVDREEVVEGRLRRYRHLLAWYPAAFQHDQGDELLGVLMAGARQDQRRPGLGESADLIKSAV